MRISQAALLVACVMGLMACGQEQASVEQAPTEKLDKTSSSIVGGQGTTIQEYPWQVSLQQFGSHFCGGSIVNEQWIVTAAHCVEDGVNGVTIVAGQTYLSSSNGQERSIIGGAIYPGYSDPSRGKDIAVLQLSSPLSLDGVNTRAIPLVTPELADAGYTDAGRIASVTGWGALSNNGGFPNQLQEVDVPIVALSDANRVYGNLTSDQLAAGLLGVGGKDSCQGDSGGPLVVSGPQGEPHLAGVVSWGFDCASSRYPGMYSRVSSFYDWVTSYTGPLDSGDPDPTPEEDPGVDPEPGDQAPGQASGSLAKNQTAVFGPYDVSDAASFAATLSGSGDPDLYVKIGAVPTTNSFDCRSWAQGPDESCLLDILPGQTQAYVMVHGYTASQFNLTVDALGNQPSDPVEEPSDPVEEPTEEPQEITVESSDAVDRGQSVSYEPLALAPNSTLRVQMTGSGDADLYVRFGAEPTLRAFDCRPYASDSNENCTMEVPADGADAYIMVNGYRAANYNLSITYTPAP